MVYGAIPVPISLLGILAAQEHSPHRRCAQLADNFSYSAGYYAPDQFTSSIARDKTFGAAHTHRVNSKTKRQEFAFVLKDDLAHDSDTGSLEAGTFSSAHVPKILH
jgi:hypothetical protein